MKIIDNNDGSIDIDVDPEEFKKHCEEQEENMVKQFKEMDESLMGIPREFKEEILNSFKTTHLNFMENNPDYGKHFSKEYKEELEEFKKKENI